MAPSTEVKVFRTGNVSVLYRIIDGALMFGIALGTAFENALGTRVSHHLHLHRPLLSDHLAWSNEYRYHS